MTGCPRWWLLLGAACAAQDLHDALPRWERGASTECWAGHALVYNRLIDAAEAAR